MKNRTITIPDMQSMHCQTRVSNAVKAIEGVQIQHLEAGKLSVSLEADNLEDEVVKTVEKLGYTIEPDSKSDSSSCTTGCCGN